MSDYIDREAAIEAVNGLPDCPNGYSDTYDKRYIIAVLEDVPSVQPQRKIGKWIAGPGNTHTCSECGFSMITNNDYIKRHYFCLNCGADMRGTE